MNLEQLKEPFPQSDVSWRIGQAGKKQSGDIWAKVLAYIDNRNIQERLDSVVGPANWKNEYVAGPGGGVLCGLSIKVDGEWITKWDGAENSDIEPIKGGLSDSMKRAAVQWGIGRYLYELGENWAQIVDQKTDDAHYANCKVKVKGQEEWVNFYWLPPRGVLPTAKVAQQVAEQNGLTTADKLPPREQPKSNGKAGMTTGDKVKTLAQNIKEGLGTIDAANANASQRLTAAEDFIYKEYKAKKLTDAEKHELDFLVAEVQKEIDGHRALDKGAAAAAA